MRPNAIIYSSVDNGSYGSQVIRTSSSSLYKQPQFTSVNLSQPCQVGSVVQWPNCPQNSPLQRYPVPGNLPHSNHPPNIVFNGLRPSFQGNLPSNYHVPNRLTSSFPNQPYSNNLPESSPMNYNASSNGLQIIQQRVSECAGIPLISNASSHLNPPLRQRQVLRKMPIHATTHQMPWMMANSSNYGPVSNSFSHLSSHAQGLPLISNKDQQKNFNQRFHSVVQTTGNVCQNQKSPQNLRYQNSTPARLKENSNDVNNLSSSSNDQSKDSNETCLPRIIKPRKRRKKDRKTANGMFVKLSSDHEGNLKIMNLPSIDRDPHQENSFKLNESPEKYLTSCLYGQDMEKALFKENFKPEQKHHIDEVNGVCFCNGCDPLRSIWDYPLRRSFSDSSRSSTSDKSVSSSSCKTKSISSNDLCEFSSMNSSDPIFNHHSEKNRAEIVGVIGSQRNHFDSSNISNMNNQSLPSQSNNYNFSSSCYGDILSGINIANDLFSKTSKSSEDQHQHQHHRHHPHQHNSTIESSLNVPLDLLPETAETLLTESINEISRKLIETCNNDTNIGLKIPRASSSIMPSSTSLSSFSTCSDFSNDSGIETNGSGSSTINSSSKLNCNDLIFNFDSLSLLDSNNNSINFNNKNKNNESLIIDNINKENKNKNIKNNSKAASSNDLNLCMKNDNFLFPLKKENTFHLKSAPQLPPPPPPPLTSDFLIDMNNNNNHSNANKMGLPSYPHKNNNNNNNNKSNPLGKSSHILEDEKTFHENFCNLVWQNDIFDENFDMNMSNISFLNNVGDSFKPNYTIT